MKADLIESREAAPPERPEVPAAGTSRLHALPGRLRSASTGLFSIFDQAIVSGTGFVSAAIIGRMTSPDQLGLYYIMLTIILMAIGVQDQVVAAPYLVYAKRRRGRELWEYSGSMWFHHFLLTIAGTIGLVVAIAILTATGVLTIVPGLWALLFAGPLILLREDIRRYSFANLNVRSAAIVDAVVCVAQLGGLLVLGYLGRLSLEAIVGVMGAACALACVGWLWIERPRVRFKRVRFWPDFRHNWKLAKWALRGHLLGSTTPYVMIWIVGFAMGPVAAGILGACTTLIGITKVLQAGVTNVLTTQSSHAFATGGWHALRRVMFRASAFLGLALGCVCLLVLVTGDALAVLVYGEFYQGCGSILFVLALSALATSLSIVIGNGLWAIDQPRANFVADASCMVVTLVAAVLLVFPLGVLGAALATLAGTVTSAIVRVISLLRAIHSNEFQPATAVASS